MANIKSTSERRSSLLPPRYNAGSPHAFRVEALNVSKSITNHNRQRDQETEAPENRNDQLNQQRHSLAQAIDVINSWKQKDLPNNSTNQQKTKEETKNNLQKTHSVESQSVNLPLDRSKTKSTMNYFYKRP